MKNLKWILPGMLAILFVFASCQKENNNSEDNIVPTSFKVDIPSSISDAATMQKSAKGDTMSGGEIYEHLRNFINIGEGAADIVQEIMIAIGQHGLNKAMELSFEGDDDGKTKNLVVVENSEFDGVNWNYQLTMTDADSEGNDDGGIGMQIFWNSDPVKGIALLKPANLNTLDTADWSKATFRIDYSEAGEMGYEKHMIVSIVELPLGDATLEPYAVSSLKMFVGKNGDIVDVYGNSNHPNATFFNQDDQGFNWAFVASGNEVLDIAVAEVGLPMSNLDATTRTILLEQYSIFNVFSTYIADWYFEETQNEIPQDILDDYLQNMKAPGFFNDGGFVVAEIAPTDQYSQLEDNIKLLTPYNPSSISNLTISFKSDSPTK